MLKLTRDLVIDHWRTRATAFDGKVSSELMEEFRRLTAPGNLGDANKAGQVPLSIKRGGATLYRLLMQMGYESATVCELIGIAERDARATARVYQEGLAHVSRLQDEIRAEAE